jgi:FKBP-type peptidyl-prolyl cis-trans isomerase 2
VVELSNGGMAVCLDVNDQELVLDANNMVAGKSLVFVLEVIGIERGQ